MSRHVDEPAAGFSIRRAGPTDHQAVARALGANIEQIGVALDPDELDHDIARRQQEDGGRSGVLLLLVDPRASWWARPGYDCLSLGVGELKRMWIRPAC